MSYVIGIDGGGTKTKAVLANDQGKVFAEATAGPSNLNSATKAEIESTFKHLFMHLKNEQPDCYDAVEFCFAGLSGTENSINRAAVEAMFHELVDDAFPYLIDHDAVNALYSGTLGDPGVVQIAGTGAIGFGIDAHLNKQRYGGWGYLFGDEGSGFSIGQHALRVIFRRYNQNKEETELTKRIRDYFNVDGDLKDIVPIVYQSASSRNMIAGLSRVVFDAGDANDEDANLIIDQAAKDLSESIVTVYEQSQISQPKVVLVGGLFKRKDVLLPKLDRYLNGRFELILPQMEPVMGSVIVALKQIGKGYWG